MEFEDVAVEGPATALLADEALEDVDVEGAATGVPVEGRLADAGGAAEGACAACVDAFAAARPADDASVLRSRRTR